MMMTNDKKKLAMIIVGGGSPKNKETSDGETELSYDDGLQAAAKKAIAAVDRSDAKAFASAIKEMVIMCTSAEDDSEDEDEYA